LPRNGLSSSSGLIYHNIIVRQGAVIKAIFDPTFTTPRGSEDLELLFCDKDFLFYTASHLFFCTNSYVAKYFYTYVIYYVLNYYWTATLTDGIIWEK